MQKKNDECPTIFAFEEPRHSGKKNVFTLLQPESATSTS